MKKILALLIPAALVLVTLTVLSPAQMRVMRRPLMNPPSGAGIVVGTPTDSGVETAQSYSFNHTCESGSNYLAVRITQYGGASDSTATYNGTSLVSQIRSFSTGCRAQIMTLASPTADGLAHSLAIALDAASVRSRVQAVCMSGVDVSGGTNGAIDDGPRNTGTSGGTITVSTTTTAANDYLMDAGCDGTQTAHSVTGTGQVQDYNQADATTSMEGMGSHIQATTIGTYTFGWGGASANWADMAIAIKPAP